MKLWRKMVTFLIILALCITLLPWGPTVAYAYTQTWRTVGPGAISGIQPYIVRMALDSEDTPYVACMDSSFNGTLYRFNGTEWETVGGSPFANNVTNESLDMALDSQDTPYATYISSATLYVMKYAEESWTALPTAGSSARYVRLALDSQDTPYVLYKNTDSYDMGTYERLTMKKYNGTSWDTIGNAGFSEQTVDNLAFALDPNDVPYVAYRYNSNVVVCRYNGESWVELGTLGAGNCINLAFDKDGVLYVSYAQYNGVVVWQYEDERWQQIGDFESGPDNSLAIDSHNHPVVAYRSKNNTGVYKVYDGAAWTAVGQQFSADGMDKPSLALGKYDQPYIACNDWADSSHPHLYTCEKFFDVKYEAGDHGTLNGTATQSVLQGKPGTEMTAVPDEHYHFVKWDDNKTDASRTDTNVQSDHTYTASFAIDQFTLKYTAGAGGHITGTATQKVDYGNSGSAVTAVPNTGYTFAGWSDGVQTAARTDNPVISDITVTANFDSIYRTLTFDNMGSTYAAKTVLKDAAVGAANWPADPVRAGYAFDGWYTGTNGAGTQYTSTTAIGANITVHAKWNAITQYTIKATANSSSYGTISGAGKYFIGTSVTLTATPKEGYRFIRWLEGRTTLTYGLEYAFTAGANRTFKAEFAKIGTPSVKATAAGYDSVVLGWKAETGAAEYEICRSSSNRGPFATIASTASTSYTDTGLDTGTTYYYKVRVKCTTGSVTTHGSYSTVRNAKPILAKPTAVQAAVVSSSSAQITWGAAPGASGYEVYSATSQRGKYTLVMDTGGNSHTQTGLATGKMIYFKVRAYRMVGSVKVYSDYSTTVRVKPV